MPRERIAGVGSVRVAPLEQPVQPRVRWRTRTARVDGRATWAVQGSAPVSYSAAATERLRARVPELRERWHSAAGFPHVVFDDLLPESFVRAIVAAYPEPEHPAWSRRTYAHQAEKLMMDKDFPE